MPQSSPEPSLCLFWRCLHPPNSLEEKKKVQIWNWGEFHEIFRFSKIFWEILLFFWPGTPSPRVLESRSRLSSRLSLLSLQVISGRRSASIACSFRDGRTVAAPFSRVFPFSFLYFLSHSSPLKLSKTSKEEAERREEGRRKKEERKKEREMRQCCLSLPLPLNLP